MNDTKENILLAALPLFAQDRYEAIAASRIVGALGMTKGALYKHYPSKRTILDQIVRAWNCRMLSVSRSFRCPRAREPKLLLEHYRSEEIQQHLAAVCFEGNIDFYGKSGFAPASTFGIRYHGVPEGEDAPFFLCKELVPGYPSGITGVYATPQGYFVDDKDVDAFDRQFPPQEKVKLAGQLFS